MSEEFRSTITQCGDLIRATVFTERGSSTQTCRTMGEAQSFIALVKARRSLAKPRQRPVLRTVE